MGDYAFHDTVRLSYETARDWTKEIYEHCGMTPEDAYVCADALVDADVHGVFSHGLLRVPQYYNRFKKGGTNPTAHPEIVHEFGATALVDGHDAMGHVVADYAVKLAIRKAKEHGTSAVSVTGSNHMGTTSYYTRQAAAENQICVFWTVNTANLMAPYGGTEAQLGNNPLGIAVPREGKDPLVLDMAMSLVAKGKIEMALRTHSPIPEGWAVDRDGKPTTDPEAAYWGTMLPFGGYKGYALCLMNAMMSAILPGAHFGPTMTNLIDQPEIPNCTGHLFQCIDIRAISDPDAFKRRVEEAVAYIKNGRKAEGVSEILVPGERSQRVCARQMAEGIVYPAEVIEDLCTISKEVGAGIPQL